MQTLTVLDREDAGYKIPRNSFMHNCKAEESSSKNKRDVDEIRAKRGGGNKKAKRSWMPWS